MRSTLFLPLIPVLLPALSIAAPQDEPLRHDGEGWTQAELEKVTRRVEKEVEKLRERAFERPVTVRLADRKTFLTHAIDRTEEFQDKSRQAALEEMAKHLGLIPHDMDLMATTLSLLEDQVGGFYDPGEDTFYLMETFTGGVAEVILAHELTHALDDQLYDLDGALDSRKESTDAMLAYSSVVEGSGTNAMQRWTMDNLSRLTMSDLTAASSMGTESLATSPPYIWKPLLATYMKGESFLSKGWGIAKKADKEVSINQVVERAFQSPPRSSEQVLHPDKYWNPKKLDEPSVVRHELDRLPDDWKVLGRDTMGELGLALFTTPPKDRQGFDASNAFALMALQYTNKAASGWDGDEVLLLGREDGARVLHLATTWDRAKDADEFQQSVTDQLATLDEIQKMLATNGQGGWMLLDYSNELQVSLALWTGCDEAAVQELRQGPLRWTEVRTPDSTTK